MPAPRPDYRFLVKPRWVLLHVLVLTAVALMVFAGLWQLSRLHGRREANALITARELEPPKPLQEVLSTGSSPDDIAANTFRQVTVRGAYQTDDQVLIRNKTNHTAPGYYVVTPLVLENGDAVAVNRGWIPLQMGDAPNGAAYAPPPGTVTVTGIILDTQRQEGMGVVDPAEGRLSTLSRIDVARLQKQVGLKLYPNFVQLLSQDPAQPQVYNEPIPDPVPPPELDDGPHLNYVGQWFIFAALTCIVYPVLLRRTAINKANAAARDEDDEASHGRAVSDDADDLVVGSVT